MHRRWLISSLYGSLVAMNIDLNSSSTRTGFEEKSFLGRDAGL